MFIRKSTYNNMVSEQAEMGLQIVFWMQKARKAEKKLNKKIADLEKRILELEKKAGIEPVEGIKIDMLKGDKDE